MVEKVRSDLQKEIETEKLKINNRQKAQKDQFSQNYMQLYDDISSTFEAIKGDNVWVM